MRYSWPGVFLLGASGRTGKFFTQLLFHDPTSIYLACDLVFLELYVVYYVSMIWHVSFSPYSNKPSAWLEASPTLGLCVFLLDKLRCRGECQFTRSAIYFPFIVTQGGSANPATCLLLPLASV